MFDRVVNYVSSFSNTTLIIAVVVIAIIGLVVMLGTGGVVAWITKPWKWIMGLFAKKPAPVTVNGAVNGTINGVPVNGDNGNGNGNGVNGVNGANGNNSEPYNNYTTRRQKRRTMKYV